MTVTSNEWGYICYGVCTCDETHYAGEECPYDSVTECPVFKYPGEEK